MPIMIEFDIPRHHLILAKLRRIMVMAIASPITKSRTCQF
jgi:hypothetical protein